MASSSNSTQVVAVNGDGVAASSPAKDRKETPSTESTDAARPAEPEKAAAVPPPAFDIVRVEPQW